MPPKASTSKRPISTRTVKTRKKAEDVEDLANQLTSKLTISKSKEKQRAIPVTPPQNDPNASMRAVNVASQKLSALVQTGWTAARDSGFSKQGQEAATCARNIKKNLNVLRETTASSPLDFERAALSAVGKLLALQLVCPNQTSAYANLFIDIQFDQASDILLDMYNPLLSCYPHHSDTPHTRIPQTPTAGGLLSRKHLFHLPLPISPLDEVTMKLLSTFLLYSMIVLSTTFSSHVPELEEASAYLAEYGNFGVWIHRCSDLPYEYRDSLCTRAYSALNKSLEASPSASFTIKFYSLRCLLPTSPSVVKADTFWDQARKFSSVYMKATHDSEVETVKQILFESSRLVVEVQRRPDKDSFLTASSFLKFCNYLSKIAAQVFALVRSACASLSL